ncbi:MAG TPA: type II 3-dehydroquinate dehydratase [Gammaproteobacteria bacterium]|nr:type II 3-dehydroquinate dehydratase [Gammaproteobacteria bacterium]
MSIRIKIINGPNLNLLGVREPHIYGSTSLETVERNCRALADTLGTAVEIVQSNSEGSMVEHIQAARDCADAIVINPAAFSFRSVAIVDAIASFEGPVIELHVSNIHARDEMHRNSIISAAATAVICGLGPWGYLAAMLAAAQLLDAVPDTFPEPLRAANR